MQVDDKRDSRVYKWRIMRVTAPVYVTRLTAFWAETMVRTGWEPFCLPAAAAAAAASADKSLPLRFINGICW